MSDANDTPTAGRYTPPGATPLGDLGQVQAGSGYYYDGPNTKWLRY